MKTPLRVAPSPIREQAANTLRRARKLPPGPYRNDLRQLGLKLFELYRVGLQEKFTVLDKARLR